MLTFIEASDVLYCSAAQIAKLVAAGRLNSEVKDNKKLVVEDQVFERVKARAITLAGKKAGKVIQNKSKKLRALEGAILKERLAISPSKAKQKKLKERLNDEEISFEKLLGEVKTGCMEHARDNTAWARTVLDIGAYEMKKTGSAKVPPDKYYDVVKELLGFPNFEVLPVGGYAGEQKDIEEKN